MADDTKIEANVKKYSFVWGRVTKTNIARITKQLSCLPCPQPDEKGSMTDL